MEKSQNTNHASSMSHRSVQKSTTLNRKYVRQPASRSTDGVVVAKKASSSANKQLSAKELKERAIKNAMRSVATMESNETDNYKTASVKATKKSRSLGGGKRFALAFAGAAACIAILAVFVNASMPDVSVRVAAIQTGIEAIYPSYIPRDYSLSNITSETGKIILDFKGPDNCQFTLTEEKSSWDSTALLNNFVKPEWEDNYTVTHEKGLTIYINNSNATWVNGGILFNIKADANILTKKQLRSIITSL